MLSIVIFRILIATTQPPSRFLEHSKIGPIWQVTHGKHKGKTWKCIADNHPEYVNWLLTHANRVDNQELMRFSVWAQARLNPELYSLAA